ncbi:MAG TPA: hypothetical protein VKB32_05440 [Actinomycetota bacterium]|nr:hypothetical protein [Actinomycetota bacterium]
MATRIETLGGGRRAPRAAWVMLFAIVLIAAALAVGTLIRSDGGTKTPARSAGAVFSAVEPATQVPGLIKAGLQPRPFSPIPTDETATLEKIPAGFAKMPGGEVRPRFGA